MTESFAELFEQSQQAISKLKPGAIVTGIVVEIRNDVVVINAGLKSEGIVPIEQFKSENGELEVRVGDELRGVRHIGTQFRIGMDVMTQFGKAVSTHVQGLGDAG